MKIVTRLALAGAIIFALSYGGAQWILHNRAGEPEQLSINLSNPELIKKGQYIAITGDCIACHTAPGGQNFAGGLAMETPLGAIYSTNITPDPETGIGSYQYADFRAAVRHGVRNDKAALFPAMPYPSYAIIDDEDMHALYAYFMHGVDPVYQKNTPPTLPKLFQIRWAVAWWQWFFAPTNRHFTALKGDDNEHLNRGKYLIEGAGHCGACHTPRGIAYQELALSLEQSDTYLSGAVIDGWRAKSLRGGDRGLIDWSEAELNDFFKTGRTDKVAAFGAMADVIQHSTQYMTDADISAMSAYLKSLPPVKDRPLIRETKKDTTTAQLLNGDYINKGAWLYVENCITCHRADGKGMPRIFPALANNSAIYANNAQSVIQITLEGGKMPHTPADTIAYTMPSFRFLSDEDVRDVVNFIRNGWDNIAPEVTAKDVQKIRKFVTNKAPHSVNAGVNND